MRITGLELERYDLELSEPYTIAYETISSATNFVLRLQTDKGKIEGFGCAAPDVPVTGETPDDVQRQFEDVLKPLLQDRDPFNYNRIIHELRMEDSIKSSVLNMVDNALFDLVAKYAGVPLYKYLGGFRESIPTSVTIGILPLEETIQKADQFIEQGFYIIKLKGGVDMEEDIEKLRIVRKKYPKIRLRFDGNQGYKLEEAIHFATEIGDVNIEIFEQPMATRHEHKFSELTDQIQQPVMADESLKTLKDSFRLAKNNRVDMINVKLMKVGGIQEGLNINSVAKSAGYEVMVGCLDECQLGISAGLHFALSRRNIEFADLDSHLDFTHDPYPGLFHLKKGVIYPNELPGLGIDKHSYRRKRK